jgi:frataxin-like iron-binding protein CyaY
VQTGELNLTTGAGNQATVLLTDRSSGTELWSKTKGGGWAMSVFNNAWVARALAKEFIKYFDSTTTTK